MPRGENRTSILLSREENDQVFSLIGPKCQSLATAVVQLFTTEDPSHSKWKKKDTGVLCLVKDNAKRSYFFRIYCLYRKSMIWEQEVYLQIEYKNPRPFLHTFEAEEYMAAFNFANENEANVLRNILLEKIELRKNRREERRQRQSTVSTTRSSSMMAVARPPVHNGALPQPPPEPEPAPAPPPVARDPPQQRPPKTTNTLGSYTLKSNKKQKPRKLTKADIGMPQDFKHVSHVGWDANKGFDLDKAPNADELRSFFNKAGVSETQLQDQETREFIYDFIEMNGGLDAVVEDLHNIKLPRVVCPPAPAMVAPAPPAPPVPSRSPAPPHPPHPPHPPAPPSRAPPPPPARAVVMPPAPPAHRTAPPRPAQPVSSGPPSVPPPPPPGNAPPPPPVPMGAPPPPPPPPAPPAPPPAPAAPPAPPVPDSAPVPDMRAALMESIRSGGKLKPVEAAPKPAVENGRSNLLSEIRQGIELRPVSRSDSSSGGSRRGAGPGGAGAGPACGLAEALQRALEERSRAIHSDSDDDMSDATTSDGEWDD